MRNRDENYPYPYEQTTLWKNVYVRWTPMGKSNNNIRMDDLALYFASSGYYRFVNLIIQLCTFSMDDNFSCQRAADCTGVDSSYAYETRTQKLDDLLNLAAASFEGLFGFIFFGKFISYDLGAVLQVNPGTYHMMCTRNNNFSNRAQKGTLIVA